MNSRSAVILSYLSYALAVSIWVIKARGWLMLNKVYFLGFAGDFILFLVGLFLLGILVHCLVEKFKCRCGCGADTETCSETYGNPFHNVVNSDKDREKTD